MIALRCFVCGEAVDVLGPYSLEDGLRGVRIWHTACVTLEQQLLFTHLLRYASTQALLISRTQA